MEDVESQMNAKFGDMLILLLLVSHSQQTSKLTTCHDTSFEKKKYNVYLLTMKLYFALFPGKVIYFFHLYTISSSKSKT